MVISNSMNTRLTVTHHKNSHVTKPNIDYKNTRTENKTYDLELEVRDTIMRYNPIHNYCGLLFLIPTSFPSKSEIRNFRPDRPSIRIHIPRTG